MTVLGGMGLLQYSPPVAMSICTTMWYLIMRHGRQLSHHQAVLGTFLRSCCRLLLNCCPRVM